MFDNIFELIFLIGLILGSGIRTWYGRQHRRNKVEIVRREGLVMVLLMSLWGIIQVLAVIYVLSPWLDFADYYLPRWAGWAGAAIFAPAQWLLWRSHADLGRNWSGTLEIQEGHSLVTNGVYRHIRHPMYAAHWLWVIAQTLLLHNWIAGFASLAVLLLIYLLRVPREEEMMLEEFGEAYRAYMERTGRIIPRLGG